MGLRLPSYLRSWCQQRLGGRPVETLTPGTAQMSEVHGLRLDDGREVAVKVRQNEHGRAVSCVQAQTAAHRLGFPCARPLTAAEILGQRVVHAEEWRPDGVMLRGDDPDTAEHFARLLARLVQLLAEVSVGRPLPNPPWVRWDHEGQTTWPAQAFLDERDQSRMPAFVEQTARRATARLRASDLPCVLGHADWETQNLRWHGTEPSVVHDWDSLAWLPESALAGAASGTFSSAETPTLAPLDSSRAFLDAYQTARGTPFESEELEVAWAASLWPAAHNARGQSLFDQPPVALTALRQQAAQRLALAGA